MSTPDEAVRAQLAEQAQTVTGTAAPLDLSGSAPTNVDTAELLARLAALEADRDAAAAAAKAAEPVPPGPDYADLSLSGAHSAELHHLVDKLERRFQALEGGGSDEPAPEPTS